jgi:hypothetical protein
MLITSMAIMPWFRYRYERGGKMIQPISPEELDIKGAGRPMTKRTEELYKLITSAHDNGISMICVGIIDDETGEGFYRFSQRARSAAKVAGLKVHIYRPESSGDSARIKIDGD